MSGTETRRAQHKELQLQFDEFLGHFFRANAERYAYGPLFEPLYHDLSEYVLRRGKRIRPLLLLRTYQVMGGNLPLHSPAILKAAAALELLHTFILIHDDVIDRSENRRSLPTFHKLMEQQLGKLADRERLGQNLAIVIGDMLFALAVDTLVSADFPGAVRDGAVRKFLQYITDTGCGETYDILLGSRDISRVTQEDIGQMYDLKTTRYTFEAPLVLGAMLAGAEPQAVHELAMVAEPLGLAFQIQNDLNEYAHFSPMDRALQTDLLEGKKTLLVRVAYEQLDDVEKSFLQLCLQSTTINESSVIKVKQLVDKSGAVPALQARQQELLLRANHLIETSSLGPAQQQGVREMMEFIRQAIPSPA